MDDTERQQAEREAMLEIAERCGAFVTDEVAAFTIEELESFVASWSRRAKDGAKDKNHG